MKKRKLEKLIQLEMFLCYVRLEKIGLIEEPFGPKVQFLRQMIQAVAASRKKQRTAPMQRDCAL